jgi:hypothetical protein
MPARVHFGTVEARMTRPNDTRMQLRSSRDQPETRGYGGGCGLRALTLL